MIDKNLEKFEGTVKEFIETLKYKRIAYFLKYRGQNSVKVWWESDDEWFLNIAKGKKNTQIYENSSWVLRTQAEGYIEFMYIKDGYEMYLEKIKNA